MSLYSPEEIALHVAVMGYAPPEAAAPSPARGSRSQQLRAQLNEICRREGTQSPARERPPEAVCRGFHRKAEAAVSGEAPKALWGKHEAPGDEQVASAEWLESSLAKLPAFALLPARVARLQQPWARSVWRAAAGRLLQRLPAAVRRPDRYLFWAAMGLQEEHWLDERASNLYAPAAGWPEALMLFALRRRTA